MVTRGEDGGEKLKLFKIMESAQVYFHESLHANSKIAEYLANRGVPENWFDRIGFGFAPDTWDGMYKHLE